MVLTKKGYGKIIIGIENGKPPIFKKELKNCSRQSCAELIATLEIIKQQMLDSYFKMGTIVRK